MKFTLSWLKKHLETEASLDDILYALTDLGLEVEEVSNPADKLKSFTLAKVQSAEQHPDADRLRVCQVETNEGLQQIVCGAPNAREGITVVLCKPGDYVPGIDVTLSCDTPGIPDKDATTHQGKGFGLHVRDSSFIADKKLVAEIEALAIKKKIPYQRTMLASGGHDGAAAQQAAAGARAVGIVVGTRYIHTVTEMIERDDLQAALDILVAYLGEF